MTVKQHICATPAVAATVATLALLHSHAHARGDIEWYGEMDTGLAYVSDVGGKTRYGTTAGLVDGSHWGLRGHEDLAGGTRAIFMLEHGFSIATGSGSQDHPAYIGLDNPAWGAVTLGYQYDAIYDHFAPFTLTGGSGGTAFAHPFDNDNANNGMLARNSIKYASAAVGGWRFGATYAFPNDAGPFRSARAYSVGASYRRGPFAAGAAYLHANGRGAGPGASDTVALPGRDRAIFDAHVRARNAYGVGAAYAFGDVTLGAAWSRSRYAGMREADSGAAVRFKGFDNYEVNATVELTPTVWLAGMALYTRGPDVHWRQGALQLGYRFSRRTDLYVNAVHQRVREDAPAVIPTADPSAGPSQSLLAVGIRHHF